MNTTDSLTSILLNQGPLGACVLALGWAVYFLVRRNDRLQEKLDAEHAARLIDQKANTTVLLEAHDQVGEGLKILDKALEHLKD